MKRILLIISIGIALALFILIFASVYEPKISVASLITPEPSVAPTPSPTPEIKILENETKNNFLFLDFHSLLDIVTTSQYNYIMLPTREYFNSVYQSNIRKYSFEQYKSQYQDLLGEDFDFANDAELKVPYERFSGVYKGDEHEYLFILDTTTIEVGSAEYKYAVDFYINKEKVESFYFVVNKETLIIKIK